MTVDAWARVNIDGYEWCESPPWSVEVNGQVVPPVDWKRPRRGLIRPDDCVRIYVEPKGAELIIAAVTLAAAALYVFSLGGAALPKPQSSSNGDRLSQSSVKGNLAKLNSPIREVAGRTRVYPDYLLPPHRYFAGKRDQVVELLLCVGRGRFEISSSNVLIGETPAISLGDAVSFALFEPGADLAGRPESTWWYSAPEVGATSTGTAGLELSTTSPATRISDASNYIFSGYDVTVPAGSGAFPSDWEPGLVVRIDSPRGYTVIDGGAGRDVIRGDFTELAPFVGMKIEITGDNEGFYVINSVTAGTGGSPSTLTGNAAPSRYDFGVTPASFTLNRNGQSWAVNLTSNVINLAGLISAINAQLSGTPLVASNSGGFLRIAENAPYSGFPLTRVLSADATTVFGASPVAVTGAATTDAEITLDFDSGGAATGLLTGSLNMGIGYSGLRYAITAASTATIAVERLTDTGAVDLTWPGFFPLTSAQAQLSLDETTLEGNWAGPFSACPDGEVTTEIEFDVFFPGGLVGVGRKNGDVQTRPATVEAQYRQAGTLDPWVSFTKTYVEKERDQIGFTERISLTAPIRPEFRMRRIGAKSDDVNTQDAVQWYGLRSKLIAPTSYAGVTVLAMTVGTSDTLASQSENLVSVTGTRILPRRVGGADIGEGPTRNPADFVRHVAKSVGYLDSDIDMAELDRLSEVWATRGDWYDNSVSDETTVKAAINDALGAGFAELSVERARLRPVRDEPRTTLESMYTPQNMLESASLVRDFKAATPEDFDGVDVEYFSDITWQWETVQCRAPGDIGFKVEKIRVPGVQAEVRAWRIGMRRRMVQLYRRWSYKFSTEMDALNSRYLSYVALGDDVPGYSQTAVMLGYDAANARIKTSEKFTWSEGAVHVCAVRRPDGSLSGPYIADRISDYALALVTPLDFTPDLSGQIEPPHLLFGTSTTWTFPALVSRITPQGLDSCTVEAANYDARVYQYDDSSPP